MEERWQDPADAGDDQESVLRMLPQFWRGNEKKQLVFIVFTHEQVYEHPVESRQLKWQEKTNMDLVPQTF